LDHHHSSTNLIEVICEKSGNYWLSVTVLDFVVEILIVELESNLQTEVAVELNGKSFIAQTVLGQLVG
jgi:hypothetical protein